MRVNRERRDLRVELWGPPIFGGLEEEEAPTKVIETEHQGGRKKTNRE